MSFARDNAQLLTCISTRTAAFQLSCERLRFWNRSSDKVARTRPFKKKKKKKNIQITDTGVVTKCSPSRSEMHENIWRRCATCLFFFLFRCRRWYAACLPFCDASYSLSLSFRHVQHWRKKRERERERLQHTRMRSQARQTRIRATHTAAPSINRCVCCFNLPWARDQRTKGDISNQKIVCETRRRPDIGATFSADEPKIGQIDESGNRRERKELTRTTKNGRRDKQRNL